MRFFDWLFGKKVQPDPVPAHEQRSPAQGTANLKPPAVPTRDPEPERRTPEQIEAENLRKWRASGQARAWVERRGGRWGHDDWLALLEELKRSPYWPMRPEAVGQALEEVKHEWLGRN